MRLRNITMITVLAVVAVTGCATAQQPQLTGAKLVERSAKAGGCRKSIRAGVVNRIVGSGAGVEDSSVRPQHRGPKFVRGGFFELHAHTGPSSPSTGSWVVDFRSRGAGAVIGVNR